MQVWSLSGQALEALLDLAPPGPNDPGPAPVMLCAALRPSAAGGGGALLAVGLGDGRVAVWELGGALHDTLPLATGRPPPPRVVQAHAQAASAAAWSADGRGLWTVSRPPHARPHTHARTRTPAHARMQARTHTHRQAGTGAGRQPGKGAQAGTGRQTSKHRQGSLPAGKRARATVKINGQGWHEEEEGQDSKGGEERNHGGGGSERGISGSRLAGGRRRDGGSTDRRRCTRVRASEGWGGPHVRVRTCGCDSWRRR